MVILCGTVVVEGAVVPCVVVVLVVATVVATMVATVVATAEGGMAMQEGEEEGGWPTVLYRRQLVFWLLLGGKKAPLPTVAPSLSRAMPQ